MNVNPSMYVCGILIDSMIAVVDGILPRNRDNCEQREENAILLTLEFDASYYDDGPDEDSDKYFERERKHTAHFIFYRPSNYTQVYYTTSDQFFSRLRMGSMNFKRTCHHDSAWRSDGVSDLKKDVRKFLERFIDTCKEEIFKEFDESKFRFSGSIKDVAILNIDKEHPTRVYDYDKVKAYTFSERGGVLSCTPVPYEDGEYEAEYQARLKK